CAAQSAVSSSTPAARAASNGGSFDANGHGARTTSANRTASPAPRRYRGSGEAVGGHGSTTGTDISGTFRSKTSVGGRLLRCLERFQRLEGLHLLDGLELPERQLRLSGDRERLVLPRLRVLGGTRIASGLLPGGRLGGGRRGEVH